MPPKYVYFYVVDAGALATMSAMADNCPNDIVIIWVAEGYARKMLIGSNIKPINTDELWNHSKYNSDLDRVLLLGPQHSFSNTVEILNKCEDLGFKTVFVTDHWSNYHLHFTKDDGTMIFPTCIFAIDNYVRSELMALGMDESQISVIGHLGLEDKINSISRMSSRDIYHIKDNLELIPGYKVIILVLELMSLEFDAEKEFGIISDVVNALYSIENQQMQLVVKPHPSQDYARLIKYIESQKLTQEIIVCPEAMRDVDAITISDLVIGVNSAMLMLPMILGIPVISVQCNQRGGIEMEYTIPYLREAIVNNGTELSTVIIEKLNDVFIRKLAFPTGSVNKAWDEIRMLQRMEC